MRKRTFFIALTGMVIACVIQFPASVAARFFLPAELVQRAQISGTIWKGRVTGIEGVGPIEFQTFPKNILSDKPMVGVYNQMPGFQARGHIRPGRVSDLSMKGRVSTFSNLDARLTGFEGVFDIRLDMLEFGEECEAASGEAFTNILASNLSKLQWQGPELRGPVSCENGELTVRVSGQDAHQNVEIVLRSNLSGVYTAIFEIETADAAAALVLPLYGFLYTLEGYSLTETGTWY